MRRILHPPVGTHSFRFVGGCGEAHEYDGTTGIDCEACIQHVLILSPEERVQNPALRGPVVATGDTPAEIARNQRAAQARRDAAAFRVEEAEDEPEPTPPADDLVAENERLKAELAKQQKPAEQKPADTPAVEQTPAYRLGAATAEAGLPHENPYDRRTTEGKQWSAGYHSVKPKDPSSKS